MEQAKLSFDAFKIKMKDAWQNISLLTYFLVICFGVGAWVAINGLWVELPVMVQQIPEGWTLPSYLTVIIQIGNIGPLLFTVFNIFYPKKIHEVPVNYVLIAIGVVSCALLAFFWKETAYIAGADRSVALLVLTFFLSTVDCTSSVTFVPYMANLRQVYLSPYFLGEGLSGLIPSLVAIVQGVGGGASHTQCAVAPVVNSSNSTNSTNSQSWGPGPKFSVEVFFWFLTGMMLLCGMAFLCLNILPITRRQKVNIYELQNLHNKEGTYQQGDAEVTAPTTRRNMYLLVILAIINGLSNGIIPSIQSYACIPYSYYIYHLTLTLSNIANPVTCLVFPLIRTKSIAMISLLCLFYCGMCTYILVIASQSPYVLLKCHNAGAVLIVFVSVSAVAIVTYCKVAISSLMRDQGRKQLLWFGISTQVGSCIGALSIFAPINVYHMFKQG